MKKFTRNLVLILIFSSLLVPFIPGKATPKPAQEEVVKFRWGSQTTALDWDPPIYHPSWADQCRWACLENFVAYPPGWDGMVEVDQLQPMLATSWDFEYWPEEPNSAGFVNRGGIKAINFTLRENVTFHDGSLWNATVAKWNIDRIFIVTGNLTGNGDPDMQSDYWEAAIDHLPFYTASWDMSSFIGQMPSYNGLVATDPALNGTFPKVKEVTVLDDGGSIGGGKVRIEWNEWNPFAIWDMCHGYPGAYVLLMSMDAYKDYWDAPIYGYGSHPDFPQDETFKHLVGTGPYIFDHWITTGPTTGGLVVKNENYWNKTALEDRGWFEVDEVDFVLFSPDQSGTDARNLAMDTDAIDYSPDIGGFNFIYENVIAQKKLVYDPSDFGWWGVDAVILNCINETYWKTSYDLGYPSPYTDGIPRLFRKAISYAFDYDGFIQTAYNGRAFRSKSFLHINNTYLNPSIPIAEFDLTIARQAMLAQFPVECALRALSMSSTDADWQLVASNNPIHTVNFYWDPTSRYTILKAYMEVALGNIGCDYYDDLAHELSPTIWTHVSGETFPFFTAQAWPMEWTTYANDIIHPFVSAYFKNPGDWSYDPYYNLAFTYLYNVTYWMDQIYYSNQTTRQELYDNIAITLQTWQYPWMWIAHGMVGSVYRREWELNLDRWGGTGDLTYIRWVGWSPEEEPIPGYPIFFILTLSAIGVIYVLMRKKKKLT